MRLTIDFNDWDDEKPPESTPLIVLGLYGSARITTEFEYRIDPRDNPDGLMDIWVHGDLQHEEHDPPDFWALMPDLGEFLNGIDQAYDHVSEPTRDDLVKAMASAIRPMVENTVAWVQPYGWTTCEGSKIPNTAEQHTADDVGGIAGWEVIHDLGDVAVFKESTDGRQD